MFKMVRFVPTDVRKGKTEVGGEEKFFYKNGWGGPVVCAGTGLGTRCAQSPRHGARGSSKHSTQHIVNERL